MHGTTMTTTKTLESVDNSEYLDLIKRVKEQQKADPPKIQSTISNQGTDPRNEAFKKNIEAEMKNVKVEAPRPLQETASDIKKLAEAAQEIETKKLEESIKEEADLWVADEMGNLVKNILANKKRLKAIESRAGSMNIDDYFLFGYIEQVVPIVPNKFYPTFRTLSGDVDLFIKGLLARELAYKNQMSDRYIMDKWGLMQVCAGLYALNGMKLQEYRDTNGSLNEDLFKKRFEQFMKYPFEVIADLMVQWSRFTERAKLLLNIDNMMDF